LKPSAPENEAEKLPETSVTTTATSPPDSNELMPSAPENEAEIIPKIL
jgi:hypothetical protein